MPPPPPTLGGVHTNTWRIPELLQRHAPNVTGEAPGYMAAVLGCVASKLLRQAAAAARESGHGGGGGGGGRIEPQHIWRAVREDSELASLVGGGNSEGSQETRAVAHAGTEYVNLGDPTC